MNARRDAKSVKKVRRPLTAYNFYFHDGRQKIQARLFKITGQRPTYTQISKLVGANWRKIKPEDKASYEALAVKDKRRYALEMLKVKQQEEHESTCEDFVIGTENNRASSVVSDSDEPEVSDPTASQCGQNAVGTTSHPGIDPSSISYQVMLRQSLNANTMSESDFLNSQNPQMIAQMTLLSKMMIDYVQKVAPERLANAQLPTGSPATTNNNDGTVVQQAQPPLGFSSGKDSKNNNWSAFASVNAQSNSWMM